MNADNIRTQFVERKQTELLARYGDVLTLAEVARVLRYPSVQAAQKARLRGTMPVFMERLPPRRGWFASARNVAEVLARFEKPVEQIEDPVMS